MANRFSNYPELHRIIFIFELSLFTEPRTRPIN